MKRPAGRTVAILAVVALALLAAIVVLGRSAADAGQSDGVDPLGESTWTGALAVSAPETVGSGSDFSVAVSAPDAPDGFTVRLALFSAVATFQVSGVVEGGEAVLAVPAEATVHSGAAEVVVGIGAAQANASIVIEPGLTVAPVVPLVGPRTIVADAQDFSMIVTTPLDPFGNPVVDLTPVSVVVRRPDGSTLPLIVAVDSGLAATIVPADTRAGRLTISTSVGDSDGPPVALDQVAGTPVEVVVDASETSERALLADGFTLHPISTGPLFDRFGNTMPDGIEVIFVIDGPDGIGLVEATVQAGAATTRFESPATPGAITITAEVSGRRSEPVTLDFATAIEAATARFTDDGFVEVGPVVGAAGGFVPDGTPVELVDTQGNVIASNALLDGVTEVPIPLGGAADDLQIVVLGAEIEVER